jgi:hypothetical protein
MMALSTTGINSRNVGLWLSHGKNLLRFQKAMELKKTNLRGDCTDLADSGARTRTGEAVLKDYRGTTKTGVSHEGILAIIAPTSTAETNGFSDKDFVLSKTAGGDGEVVETLSAGS